MNNGGYRPRSFEDTNDRTSWLYFLVWILCSGPHHGGLGAILLIPCKARREEKELRIVIPAFGGCWPHDTMIITWFVNAATRIPGRFSFARVLVIGGTIT